MPAAALLLALLLTVAGCSGSPDRVQADQQTPRPGTGSATADVDPDPAARPIAALEAYPGLDASRLIGDRVWAAHPTDDPSSTRRLTRTSRRETAADGGVLLNVSLDDTEAIESSDLRLVLIDHTVRLTSLQTSDSTLGFEPPLEVWPDSLAPNQAVTSTAAVTGNRGGNAVEGTVTHTLSDRTTAEDTRAGLKRVESVFAFDLGLAKVTRTSTRWFAMPASDQSHPRLQREQRERSVQAWIFPIRSTRSDWTAIGG